MSVATKFKYLIEIGPGFWNIRGSYKLAKGLIDIGTQMSIIQLPNGKFMVVDTIPLTDKIKEEIDTLTNNGSSIEFVLATHPFHTLAFAAFYNYYPTPKYYGSPRHIRKITIIPWVGDLNECKTRSLWLPEIDLRIPEGSDFATPQPEKSNHFCCCFVYHKPSKTIHVDDTLMCSPNPSFLLKLGGYSKGGICFHPSIKGPGLLPDPEAPFKFRDWMNEMLKDWDFDNLCAAHFGNKIGGCHEQIEKLVKDEEGLFKKLSEKRKQKNYSHEDKDAPELSVDGTECG